MIYEHERKPKKQHGPAEPMPEENKELHGQMLSYLEERRLSYQTALYNRWYPATINGTARIVIPCSNSIGVPYYQARAMSKDVTLRYKSPFSDRVDSIVVVWPVLQWHKAVIVEGPADALAAATAGAMGVGVMGNKPSLEVIKFVAGTLKHIKPKEILIVPDLDTPQMGADIAGWLAKHGVASQMRLPTKKDLAEMSIKERENLIYG